jgi:hypothetical protein
MCLLIVRYYGEKTVREPTLNSFLREITLPPATLSRVEEMTSLGIIDHP